LIDWTLRHRPHEVIPTLKPAVSYIQIGNYHGRSAHIAPEALPRHTGRKGGAARRAAQPDRISQAVMQSGDSPGTSEHEELEARAMGLRAKINPVVPGHPHSVMWSKGGADGRKFLPAGERPPIRLTNGPAPLDDWLAGHGLNSEEISRETTASRYGKPCRGPSSLMRSVTRRFVRVCPVLAGLRF
jgi:hypothetical protein